MTTPDPTAPGSEPLDTIVVGTTLDEASDAVVRVALAVARAAGARLHLAHAFPPPYVAGVPFGFGVAGAPVEQGEARAAGEALTAQAERLGVAPGELAGRSVLEGAPHRVLTDLARESGAGLLVVGATAGGALDRLLGSTADRVVRKACCPVLVVRGGLAVPPRKVLAPVDLSPLSAEAFRRGLALLARISPQEPPLIEALFVLGYVQRQVAPQFTPEQVDRFAAEELERFLAAAGPAGAAVRPRVRTGNVREQVLAEAGELGADLVVLGTHGLGGFDRVVIGSVAADVVREAPSSVLVVPPRRALGA